MCVCPCFCLQVRMCFGISLQNQGSRGKLLLSRSRWRAALRVHFSFKTVVNENHLIISPERFRNCTGLGYSGKLCQKSQSVNSLNTPPEMRDDIICSCAKASAWGAQQAF